jgi:hypothetical protein
LDITKILTWVLWVLEDYETKKLFVKLIVEISNNLFKKLFFCGRKIKKYFEIFNLFFNMEFSKLIKLFDRHVCVEVALLGIMLWSNE